MRGYFTVMVYKVENRTVTPEFSAILDPFDCKRLKEYIEYICNERVIQ